MLKCEGMTIRKLREQFAKHEDDDIDIVITEYLNSKPGTWSLRTFTANQFGFYFIWSVQ